MSNPRKTIGATVAFSAGIALAAHAQAGGYPAPGSHDGYGEFSIQSVGRIPAVAGQVVAGMYDDDGHNFHWRTMPTKVVAGKMGYPVYRMSCNTSAYNDRLGDRAHLVSVTWYPSSWGSIPFGTNVNDPFPWHLPRPQGSLASFPNGGTGGTTFANTWGDVDADPNNPSFFEPFGSLFAEGLIYTVGTLMKDAETGMLRPMTTADGAVTPGEKWNGDFVLQAVVNPRHPDHPNPGDMHALGSSCRVHFTGYVNN